jgi:hypothetical protein
MLVTRNVNRRDGGVNGGIYRVGPQSSSSSSRIAVIRSRIDSRLSFDLGGDELRPFVVVSDWVTAQKLLCEVGAGGTGRVSWRRALRVLVLVYCM